jgi:hypothetical protein
MKKIISIMMLVVLLIASPVSAISRNINTLTETQIKQAIKEGQNDLDDSSYILQMRYNYTNIQFLDREDKGSSISLLTPYRELKTRAFMVDPEAGEHFNFTDAKKFYKEYDKTTLGFSFSLESQMGAYFHWKMVVVIMQNGKITKPTEFDKSELAFLDDEEGVYRINLLAYFPVKLIDMNKPFQLVIYSPDVKHKAIYDIDLKKFK